MKFHHDDWGKLRLGLCSLAVALCLNCAAIYLVLQRQHAAQQIEVSLQKQWRAAQENLAQLREEQNRVNRYFPAYQTLIARRVIGVTSSLDWMARIEKLRAQNLVADFHYTLVPQTDSVSNNEFYTPHFSEVKVQLSLLHEQQLLNFFAALSVQLPGLYQVKSCAIKRPSMPPPAAQLTAECTVARLTLEEKQP